MKHHFKLPYPPSLNTIYKWSPRGIYLSKEARNYKNYVGLFVKTLKLKPFTDKEDLSLTIMAYPSDKRIRDISNLEKLVGDSLKKILFPDDRQIKILHMEMKNIVKSAYIEVIVSNLTDDN